MSVFTNPASRSAEQAREYTDAILGLLGDRNPLEILAATPDALRSATDGLSGDAMRAPEAPGKWAINQVLQHLADSDLIWGWRLRLVIAHDRPPLTGYDQDAWAQRLGYAESDPAAALEDFETLRRINLRLVRRLDAADLQRVGVHGERGEESVAHMMRLYAGHDILHLRQIERIRATVSG